MKKKQHVSSACQEKAAKHLFAATQSVNLLDAVSKGRFKRPGMKGELNPRSKLNDEAVTKIRQRYATESIGPKRLAREYGVAHSLIQRIVKGIAWPHLPMFSVSPEVRKSKLTRRHLYA